MSAHFSEKDVADYYDQTRIHYRYFWQLDQYHTLHYGLWEEDVKSLGAAMLRTNERLTKLADIQPDMRVLDAGCGIGGPARWLASKIGCEVVGLSLSERQVHKARALSKEQGLEDRVHFEVGNYCQTGFADASFDVVWAIEAHATEVDKEAFIQEAFRLLKPGGCLVMADYLSAKPSFSPQESALMMQWLNHWAITELANIEMFAGWITRTGFDFREFEDVTARIMPSALRMYWASFPGWLGTKAYNLFRRATPFSRTHYKASRAQYLAVKRGLWQYVLIKAIKPV